MLLSIIIWILCGFIPIFIARIITKEKAPIWQWILWSLLGEITLGIYVAVLTVIGCLWLAEKLVPILEKKV